MTTLSWQDREALADEYSPRLVLFPEVECLGRPQLMGGAGDYHPRSIDLLIENGRFFPNIPHALWKLNFGALFNARAWPHVTQPALEKGRPSDQIRLNGHLILKPAEAWTKYFKILRRQDHTGLPGSERYPLTTYVQVVTRAEAVAQAQCLDYERSLIGAPFYSNSTARDDDVALQFWFSYYYDDWHNIHEGDWEGICVYLRRGSAKWEPLGATYYEHENGTRRHWPDIETVDKTHPVVYVASGSHASYFQHVPSGHRTSIAGKFLPGLRLRIRVKLDSERYDFVPDRARHDPVRLNSEVLLKRCDPNAKQIPLWEKQRWLTFPGSWGAQFGKLIAAGPTGPAQKGLKWANPFAWSESEGWGDSLVY